VPFTNGRPEGFYENFATGFWISGERRAEVWGRPAALAVAKDGSLLVADDTGGTIWRISYPNVIASVMRDFGLPILEVELDLGPSARTNVRFDVRYWPKAEMGRCAKR
jgi:hypothetical protein